MVPAEEQMWFLHASQLMFLYINKQEKNEIAKPYVKILLVIECT